MTITPERDPRAEQQGDGQPENVRELQDTSGGAARAARAARDERGTAGMGGTSDAGSAADEATEDALFDRGLPDDRTRQKGGPR